MRYLSVCSGIEAASVAFKPLGWEPAGLSEIEAFPRAVLEHRHNAVAVDWDHRWTPGQNFTPMFGDFTQIEAHHVGPVDLLIGGTPCQSFSIAGKRLGLDDPRGNLAIEFLALAKRIGARWIVWENVPGVRSSWSGEPDDETIAEWQESCDFAAFLDLFRECGYRGGWRTLDAQFTRVAGFERAVPQRRQRVFVVGHIGDNRALPVLFDRDSLHGHPAPRRQAGEGVAATLEASTGGCSGKDGLEGRLIAANSGDVAFCLVSDSQVSNDAERETLIAFPERMSATQCAASENVSPVLQSHNPTAVAFSCKDFGADASDDVSPTLRSIGHDSSHANGGGQMAVAFDIAGTICKDSSTGGMSGRPEGAASGHLIAHNWAVRRLTPRECERLQGFPDDFSAIPWRGKPAEQCPDGPRYKALGNSMAVNVMRWLGERIDMIDRALAERLAA